MAEPAFILGRPDTSSRTGHPPTRLPYYQGVLLLIASFILGQQFVSRMLDLSDSIDDRFGARHVTLLVGALVTGAWGLFRLLRSLKTREFARNHPDEPWRWDHPWTLETVAPQVSRTSMVLAGFSFALFAFAIGGLVCAAVVMFASIERENDRFIAGAVYLGAAGLVARFGWKSMLKHARRRVRARLYFGQVRLRLPQIPLPLGGSTTVELVAEHDVPAMNSLSVTLRRVRRETRSTGRGKNEKRVTTRKTMFHRTQTLDFESFTAAHPLVIPLRFPAKDPKEATWRQPGEEVYWELHIDGFGKKESQRLKTTFRLPVYFTGGPLDTEGHEGDEHAEEQARR